MTYGLTIIGESGAVQIDDTYKNLALKSKGSVVSGSPAYATVVETNCVNPVIAFSCAVSAALFNYSVTGSTYTFTFVVNGSGQTLDYWIFDEPPAAATSGYGLVVKDASGGVTFDSGRSYMRVVDFFGPVSAASHGTQHTYASGRTYAAVQAAIGFFATEDGPGPGNGLGIGYACGLKKITNGFQQDNFSTGIVPDALIPLSHPGHFMIVDVTNL